MANSTLDAVRIKVRRLTQSPSEALLTNAQIDEYVNTFIQYDFPEHLRLFSLRTTYSFYTNPGQDVYPTDIESFVGATDNPLYNFQNRFITVHPPLYIAGYQAFYTQSREQFFGIYPFINSIASIGTSGNGITTNFVGVINTAQAFVPPNLTQQIVLLQDNVLFSSIDTNGLQLALVDVPLVDPVSGYKTPFGNLYVPGTEPATPPLYPVDLLATNQINYQTGAFNITFSSAPAANAFINSQTVLMQPSLPVAICYYDNQFIVRPVPDQAYAINFEVYVRPTELLSNSQSPELEQWWQYIAYGAAKKIFEDRMEMESVQLITPEFKQQERLVLRRTIVQQTNERTSTIYTENVAGAYGPGFIWGGGAF